MVNLSLFTDREAVELILEFYTCTLGGWNDELDKAPEAKRFVDMGYTCFDDEYPDLHRANKRGDELLHEYIKKISDNFIENIKMNGLEQKRDNVNKWFYDNLNLETMEDAEEISEYICRNLYHYGYKLNKCYSTKKGNFYLFEKL